MKRLIKEKLKNIMDLDQFKKSKILLFMFYQMTYQENLYRKKILWEKVYIQIKSEHRLAIFTKIRKF